MKRIKHKKIIIIAVVLISFNLNCVNIFPSSINEVSLETLAVTLVIDTSGSMATTDPHNLRETAANIFIDLLSPDDFLGIVTFNTKEDVVVPMQQIQSNENKYNFKQMVSQKLQSTGGDTDYLVALNEANNQLKSIDKGNVRKVILFLTDGEPDPDNTKKNDVAFMNSYMDSLWKSVSDLALNKYSVYSVGFSKGVDPAILERISSSTQGTLKISDDSSELALSFFDILGTLKNRKSFLDKIFELKGNDSLEFDLDQYTSQATIVFINPNVAPLDITLSDPNGKDGKNAITINKSDKYSIVTVNQKNEKILGKWKVDLKGDGSINAFGNKDLFIKPWLVTPETGSLHPLKEPLDISVKVTGEVSQNLSIEAIMTKDGVQDENPIKLELKDSVYKSTYENVDKTGKYDIEIRLMLNGQLITRDNSSFIVRELPSIATDFLKNETQFRLGEKLQITSSLRITDNNLLPNSELQIENYNLLLNYIDSGTEIIPLMDNGSQKNGDAKINDGIWTSYINLKEDEGNASLIVNGTYRGEKFLLEKSLGTFEVYSPGEILVKQLNNELYTSVSKQLKIPLEIENTSNLKETLIVSINEDVGTIEHDKITLDPLNTLKTNLLVNVDKNLDIKDYDINIKISPENPLSKVEPAEIKTKVQVVSEANLLLRDVKKTIIPIVILVVLIAGEALVIILIGLLLYRLLVYKNTIIQGKLLYWKQSEGDSKEKIDLRKLRKDKIIISFNNENKAADYNIQNDEYNYDIELTVDILKGKWKFVQGFKALAHRNNSTEILLKTTKPGIFIYEDKIFTSRKINKNDSFSTGGYVFQYSFNDKKKIMKEDKK